MEQEDAVKATVRVVVNSETDSSVYLTLEAESQLEASKLTSLYYDGILKDKKAGPILTVERGMPVTLQLLLQTG